MNKAAIVISTLFIGGLSLLFFPYINDYFISPISDLAFTLFPDMGDTWEFTWKAIPWLIYIGLWGAIIIAIGIGLKGGGDSGGDED